MPFLKINDDGNTKYSKTSQTKIVFYWFFIVTDGANSEVCLALYRKSLKSKDMDHDGTHFDGLHPHVFITLGASVS